MTKTLSPDEIKATAEYACLQWHPQQLRSRFSMDITCAYRAEEIVYALQALSSGAAGLFVGLLTNYLHDKFKKPDPQLVAIEVLLVEQQRRLARFETLINAEKNQRTKKLAMEAAAFHRSTIKRVEESDPAIEKTLEQALAELRAKGAKALNDEIIRRA
jgi:hypothetical protein